MMRKIATGVFVICLAAWSLLAVVLCMTIIGQGWGGIVPKMLHLAGGTDQLGVQSGSLVVWRLLGLLALTLAAGYFQQPRRSKLSHP